MFMSTAEVQAILPGVCTEDNLKIAIQVIETYTGIFLDGTYSISTSDTAHLRRAVAFQAMWLNSQDDFLARLGTNSFSVDGAAMSANEQNMLVLAPLAKRSLRNLSFRNSSVRPRTQAEVDAYYNNRFLTVNSSDDGWVPLG